MPIMDIPQTQAQAPSAYSVNTTLYLEYPDPDKPRISISEIEDVHGVTDTLYIDAVVSDEENRRINEYLKLAPKYQHPLRVSAEVLIRAGNLGGVMLAEGKLFYIHSMIHQDGDPPRFYARTITLQAAPDEDWSLWEKSARYYKMQDAERMEKRARDRAVAESERESAADAGVGLAPSAPAAPAGFELPPAYAPLVSPPTEGGDDEPDAPISPAQTPMPAPAARAMPDRRLHFLPRGGGGAAQCGADIGGLRMCRSIAYLVNAYARGEVVCADCWGIDGYAVGRVVRMAGDESEAELPYA